MIFNILYIKQIYTTFITILQFDGNNILDFCGEGF